MKTKVTILLISSLVFAFICTALLDRIFIRSWANSIAIPRAKRMIYKTPEFQYTADINFAGFRDREFPQDKDPSRITIAVLGDSFTYGWGVEEPESWPRLLEEILQSQGYPAVVRNLGMPGYFPYMYAANASYYLPALKPDIVLIGVLQGDDLAQMEQGDCSENEKSSASIPKKPIADATLSMWDAVREGSLSTAYKYMQAVFRMLYPHVLRVRSYRSRTQTESLSVIWKKMAGTIRSRFSPKEQERFTSLDSNIQDMFLRGDLNPTLIQIAITSPSLFADLGDTEDDKTRDLIFRMSECLQAAGQASKDNGAKICAVVSIPYGIYACKKSYANREHLGLYLYPSMLKDDSADTAISMACQKAGIPFISVIDDFRGKAAVEDLYFTYDGHFNAKGHAVYAALIAPEIINILSVEEWGKQLTPNYH